MVAFWPFIFFNKNRADLALVKSEAEVTSSEQVYLSNINSKKSLTDKNISSLHNMIPNFVIPGPAPYPFIKPEMHFNNSYFTLNFIKSLLSSSVLGNRCQLQTPFYYLKGCRFTLQNTGDPRKNIVWKFMDFLKGPFVRRLIYLNLVLILFFYFCLLIFIYPPYRHQLSYSTHKLIESTNHAPQNNVTSLCTICTCSRPYFPVDVYAIKSDNSRGQSDEYVTDASASLGYKAVPYRPDLALSVLKNDTFYFDSHMLDEIENHQAHTPHTSFINFLIRQTKRWILSLPSIDILHLCKIINNIRLWIANIVNDLDLSFTRKSQFTLSALPLFRHFQEWMSTFWDDPEDPEDPPFEYTIFVPVIGFIRVSLDTTELDSFSVRNPLTKDSDLDKETIFSLTNISASLIINVHISSRFFDKSLASIRCVVENLTLSLTQPTESSFPTFNIYIPTFKTYSISSSDTVRSILDAVLNKWQNTLSDKTQIQLYRRLNRSLRVSTKKISQVLNLSFLLKALFNLGITYPVKYLVSNLQYLLKRNK